MDVGARRVPVAGEYATHLESGKRKEGEESEKWTKRIVANRRVLSAPKIIESQEFTLARRRRIGATLKPTRVACHSLKQCECRRKAADMTHVSSNVGVLSDKT
jgi:hypothetical protein